MGKVAARTQGWRATGWLTRSLLWATMVGVLTGGCATTPPAPFTPPSQGGAAWLQVTTPHFVLATDHERKAALAMAAELEATFATLSELGFEAQDVPGLKIEVVYFRRDDERALVAKRRGLSEGSGFFSLGRGYDFERERLAVVGADLPRFYRSLRHQLTHFFIDYHYPQAPAWLHEGLAMYYAAMDSEDGVVTLGRLADGVLFHEGPWASACAGGNCVAFVPAAEASAVNELAAMTWEEFHTGQSLAETTEAAREKANRAEVAHHASAFHLVRLLQEDPAYQASFTAYLARVRAGDSARAAWRTSLAQLNAAKLEAAYRASLMPKKVVVRQTRYQPRARPADGVRALSEGEVRAYWARLWPWDETQGRAGAGAELERLPAAHASGVEGILLRASWMNAAGLGSAATDLLETGLKAYPDEPRLLAALGWVILRGDSGPQRTRELAVIEARLGPRARRSGQLDLLGRTSLERGDLDATVGYERRALALDPTCAECLGTMARALAAVDHYAEALAAARLGQGYQHHGGGSPALAAQIAEYDARLDASAGERAWAQASEACGGAHRARHKVSPKGAGQLPAETVRGVLRGLKPALAACYDDGRTRNPTLSGTVVVAFSIESDGRVSGVDTTCDTLKDRAVTSCVVDAYRGLVFPPPEGGAMPISTPVVFAP